MSRPKTKVELQQQSQQNYAMLNDYIDSLSSEEQQAEFPEGTLNRNIRDVLAHLHHWHLMFLHWYQVGMQGEKPYMPAKGYTWATVPELNRKIQAKYQNEALSTVRDKLNKSYAEVHKFIGGHSDQDLFEKKRYRWTGSTSLGAYSVSATSSHYEWAHKLIKRCTKQQIVYR